MCKLKEPFISKCGHTFCKACIAECVNRQHECPQCRQKLEAGEIFRNFSLEVLLQRLQEERDKESHRYFEQLAGNVFNQHDNVVFGRVGMQDEGKSPIETVFALNLRESLLQYQGYLEQLDKEKEAIVHKIKQ
mmetsp:Transcript_48376/g.35585  ORF Transcript_48376/g.35585 Transcript_48376/m.35585 type:complete len:133 (-) Transcript_48376:72-470(-)